MSGQSAFTNTAVYRTAAYDQAYELKVAGSLSGYDFSVEPTEDTRFGVCLALCVQWIKNKLDLLEGERVRGPDKRVGAMMASPTTRWFKDSMNRQQAIADAVNRHQWDMTAALKDVAAEAPDIYEVTKDGSPLDVDTVIVRTLTPHVPYILVYRWAKGGHAVVCYRTNARTMIFDPNCGEIACAHGQIDAMWAAYWKDVAAVFKGLPATYGLAAVGADPDTDPKANIKKKRKCLLATAACDSRGLPEDWFELELLRRFRDGPLAATEAGRADIARYYRLAPRVVDHISAHPASALVFSHVYGRYVSPAAALVRDGAHAEAAALFRDLLIQMEAVLRHGPEALAAA